jgi:hypothetical protein
MAVGESRKSLPDKVDPVRRRGRVALCRSSPRNHFSANSLLALQEAVQLRSPSDLRSPLGSGRGQRSHRGRYA